MDTPPDSAQELAERMSPAELDQDSWRWLASHAETQMYAVQAPNDTLCVVLSDADTGDTATCGSWEEVDTSPPLIRYSGEGSDLLVALFVDDVVAAALADDSLVCRVRDNVVFITHPPADAPTIIATSADRSEQAFEAPGLEGLNHSGKAPACG